MPLSINQNTVNVDTQMIEQKLSQVFLDAPAEFENIIKQHRSRQMFYWWKQSTVIRQNIIHLSMVMTHLHNLEEESVEKLLIIHIPNIKLNHKNIFKSKMYYQILIIPCFTQKYYDHFVHQLNQSILLANPHHQIRVSTIDTTNSNCTGLTQSYIKLTMFTYDDTKQIKQLIHHICETKLFLNELLTSHDRINYAPSLKTLPSINEWIFGEQAEALETVNLLKNQQNIPYPEHLIYTILLIIQNMPKP